MAQINNNFTILDIGTAKTTCFIAENINDSLSIKGIGQRPSQGIKSGTIIDMKTAQDTIKQAVQLASQITATKVKRLHINIPSHITHSKLLRIETPVYGKEISSNDLTKLTNKINEHIDREEFEIIHSSILNYTLDGNSGIQNPLGMYAKHIACDINTIVCPRNILLNIQHCLLGCKLDIATFISSSLAASYACISEDEKNYGCIFIELGAGTSNISVFKDGKMIFADGVPLGGQTITNDLVQILGTNFYSAEKIKTLYGSLEYDPNNAEQIIDMFEDEEVQFNREISKQLLVDIIYARMEEIIDLLIQKLHKAAVSKTSYRVVITGGGANFKGILSLFAQKFGQSVRIADPCFINGIAENVSGRSFSTPIGMLKYINYKLKKDKHNQGNFASINKLLHWLKENF